MVSVVSPVLQAMVGAPPPPCASAHSMAVPPGQKAVSPNTCTVTGNSAIATFTGAETGLPEVQ